MDLESVYRINKSVLDKIREKHRIQGMDEEDYLTELQKTVFSDPYFWDETKHIIIQGRTSSGKTLVAQIAAAYYGAKELPNAMGERMKIIYLVPLRAMVSEKRAEFITLFEETLGWKVYASSSDYQDHDEDILSGNFHVAVIVYEKFFALLAQDNQSSFITNCGLIIVDELQMINDEGRGPKLEVSLTKIISTQPNCKIIGLTTTQCNIEEISKWLSAKPIINLNRPKALEEYVIWPGEAGDSFYYYMLENPEDGNIVLEKNPDGGEKIDLKNQNINIFENDLYTEQKMIPALISHILESDENKMAKILVFINNRRDTKKIAEDICCFLKGSRDVYDDIIEDKNIQLLLSSGDEDAADMRINTLPYGVAYHHGGLSRGLRDYIEDEFRNDKGKIHIIVATETLAIGVNMPTDIVILAGVIKPNAKNIKNKMRSHEYKNYVGRAGRLGKSSASRGKSYLLAPTQAKANDYWDIYIKAKQVPVLSALRKLTQKEQVPYFFNLIDPKKNDSFDMNTFNELIQDTFAFYDQEYINKLPGQTFIEYLLQYGLIETNPAGDYSRSRIGDELVSYALNLDTVKTICTIWNQIKVFFNKGEKDSRKIIEFFKEHCLDFLYCLSGASELKNVFVQNRDEMIYTQKALKFVRRMQNGLIVGMPLWNMVDEVFNQGKPLPNLNRSFAVKRAISMFGWIKGKQIAEIKQDTGLDYIAFGDLDRLGDVFAYLWEAMVRVCLVYMEVDEPWRISSSLMHFSGCLKYGVEEDLVVLASRHIQYITRGQLVQLKEEAERKQLTIEQYIRDPFLTVPPKALSLFQYRQMVEELNKYYYASNPIGNISFTVRDMVRRRILDRDVGSLIENISNWQADSLRKMSDLFVNNTNRIVCHTRDNCIELYHDGTTLYIYCIEGNEPITGDDFLYSVKNLRIQDQENREDSVRIYISAKGFVEEKIENLDMMKGVCLSVTAFLKLYLLSLKKTSALSLFCKSLYNGYNYIPDNDQSLNHYIMNFLPSESLTITEQSKVKSPIKLYLIYDKTNHISIYNEFIQNLKKEIMSEQLELEIRTMVWGDRLHAFANEILEGNEYVLIIIDDNYQNQRGLSVLMNILKDQLSEKRLLLFYNDENVKETFFKRYSKWQNCDKMMLSLSNCEEKSKKVCAILKKKKEENDMYDVFISYATGQVIANQMRNILEDKGCKVFIDKILHVGDSLVDSINNALRDAKSYLLVIDKDFIKSAWANQEAKAAFLMALKNRRIFPLLVDDEAKKYWIEENPLYADYLGRIWNETNANELADEIVNSL